MSLSYITSWGATHEMGPLGLGLSINPGTRVQISLPIDLVQEKLREAGYELIAGPKKRKPAEFRHLEDGPRVSFSHVPNVEISLTVAKIQEMERRADPHFDVYPIKQRKDGWK